MDLAPHPPYGLMECSHWPTQTQTQTQTQTLTQTLTQTPTQMLTPTPTPIKWVSKPFASVSVSVLMSVSASLNSSTYYNRTHFFIGVCVCVSVGQCEHSINFLDSMQFLFPFFFNVRKIACPPEGWCPLRRTLDPPLQGYHLIAKHQPYGF